MTSSVPNEQPSYYIEPKVQQVCDAEGDLWERSAGGWRLVVNPPLPLTIVVGARELVTCYGPVTPVAWAHSDGVTTPGSVLAALTPEQVDERTARITGIRALADLLEQRTDLPLPYGASAQMEFTDRTELERTAVEFGVKLASAGENGQTWGEVELGGGVAMRICGWFPAESTAAVDPDLLYDLRESAGFDGEVVTGPAAMAGDSDEDGAAEPIEAVVRKLAEQ